jgi:plasmid stability protein
MDPYWLRDCWVIDHWLPSMAKTLTLKNLPDALHARLAAAAKRHRRSLNNEAIVCLEAGLGSASPSVEQQLAEIRALRESLGPHTFDPAEIDAAKREGRP